MLTDQCAVKRIVVLGGYGVFGGLLSQALLRDNQFDVVVAGRTIEKAQAFCTSIGGGSPAFLDRADPAFGDALARLGPFITIDAAGPFQLYGQNPYQVAEAALDIGSHYLDLSDDPGFTHGITRLNDRAGTLGLVALSGVSSVPALSSAAVETLQEGFREIDLIETTILPGNRAPRGLSVIRAILSQIGRPVMVTRGGRSTYVTGWSGLEKRKITSTSTADLEHRWSSFVGSPDLALFPKQYGAESVLFRAGLELPFLHIGLYLLSFLVRMRLVKTLEPASKIFQTIADWFGPFGSDRGGMQVLLQGPGKDGNNLERVWSLIAEAGDGPHIPAVAANVLCQKLATKSVAPGARACLGEVTLKDIDAATAHLSVATSIQTKTWKPLFEQALGASFWTLPKEVRELHRTSDQRNWVGKAEITRGGSWLVPAICGIAGFPKEAAQRPIAVTITACGDKEVWCRDFGGRVMRSVLGLAQDPGDGIVTERFGAAAFDIGLEIKNGALMFPVSKGRLFGISIPKWLLPISETQETSEDNRFCFDVKVSIPLIGPIVRYRGWLEPE